MLPQSGRGVAEGLPRGCRGAAEMWPRCGRDVAEMWRALVTCCEAVSVGGKPRWSAMEQ